MTAPSNQSERVTREESEGGRGMSGQTYLLRESVLSTHLAPPPHCYSEGARTTARIRSRTYYGQISRQAQFTFSHF